MRDLIPTEPQEALVVKGCIFGYDNIRLKVRFPVDLVGCCGSAPFGVVGGGVAFRPNMISEIRKEYVQYKDLRKYIMEYFWDFIFI